MVSSGSIGLEFEFLGLFGGFSEILDRRGGSNCVGL